MVDLDRRSREGSRDESGLAVVIDGLEVTYDVYQDKLGVDHRLRAGRRQSTVVEAVRGVTLDVGIGETVGIVGSNGSGKSTLLSSIGGLAPKSAGSVRTRGEVRLLGVGAVLKPRLSGYRNVMLGGLAMGMPRDEIRDQLDEIAEFTGLGVAMGRPLNTYSSGMRARLAFSIATLRIPDVLLIDEALAVGDRTFKRKSLKRINEIRESAGTVIMVAHNLGEIRKTCTRAIWMDSGRIRADGDVPEILAAYEASDD